MPVLLLVIIIILRYDLADVFLTWTTHSDCKTSTSVSPRVKKLKQLSSPALLTFL